MEGAHCYLVISRTRNEANQPYGTARKQRGTQPSTKLLLEHSIMINFVRNNRLNRRPAV
jgi:hypothetical protein